MLKKSLLAIVAATALLGFNSSSFAEPRCPIGYHEFPDFIMGDDHIIHEVYTCQRGAFPLD